MHCEGHRRHRGARAARRGALGARTVRATAAALAPWAARRGARRVSVFFGIHIRILTGPSCPPTTTRLYKTQVSYMLHGCALPPSL